MPHHAFIIIGNGFDLDLGLPTRYSDFANENNPEWKDWLTFRTLPYTKMLNQSRIKHSLLSQLYEARCMDNWFDIEEEIHKFVKSDIAPDDIIVRSTREQHDELTRCFSRYLKRIIAENEVKQTSLACDFMRRIITSDLCYQIVSFNYTDCLALCGCENKNKHNMIHIHGSINSNNQVLGCRAIKDERENPRYDFLYKSSVVQASAMRDYTNISDETNIIIFGHSLNEIDSCYFIDIFVPRMETSLKKSITIICKDEASEVTIRNNICSLTGECPDSNSNMDVTFIHTAGWYGKNSYDINSYSEMCKQLKI